MNTLLACALCGCDDLETSPFPYNRERTEWIARCGNPVCGVELVASTPEEVIERWNRTASHRGLAWDYNFPLKCKSFIAPDEYCEQPKGHDGYCGLKSFDPYNQSTWDIYDWITEMSNLKLTRRCPKCKDIDVKYGIHNKKFVGVELSVRCNACHHTDSGNNSGVDLVRMVHDWHE